MYLVAKRLNVALYGERFLELLDGFRVLILGSEHAYWDFDTLGIIRIDHGGVDFCDGGKWGIGLGA